MLVMGGIIGSGIFVNPAEVARRGRRARFWIVGVWLIGGAIAIAGAFVYAELAARRPEVGGQYAYLRDAWGPMPAFLYGWSLLLVIQSGGMAAVAITFARYFRELTALAVPDGAVAAAVLALLTAINCLGVRAGSNVQSVLMVLKIVAIAALVLCGLLLAGPLPGRAAAAPARAPLGHARRARRGADPGDVRLWRLADRELRRRRDARSAPRPRARPAVRRDRRGRPLHRRRLHLRRSCSGPQGLAATHDAGQRGDAARAGRHRRDPDRARHRHLDARLPQPGHADRAARLFRDGRGPAVLPQASARSARRTRVPVFAILLQGAVAIAIALTGTYGQILSYVVSVDFIWFALTGAALFVFRRRDADGADGFRAPGHPFTTGLFVLACAAHRGRAPSGTTRPTARSASRSCSPASRPSSTGWSRR